MKYLKLLGLVAIAAMGLTTVGGTSAASATTLTDGTNTLKTGSAIALSLEAGDSLLDKDTSGNSMVTCTVSTVGGKTTNETGDTVNVNIETLDWEGCGRATATGSLSIKRTGENEGEVSGVGIKVTLNIFSVSCVYGTGEGTKLGILKGGKSAVLTVNAVTPKVEGGFLCPSTSVWQGQYIVTNPATLGIIS